MIRQFKFKGDDVRGDIVAKYGFEGELVDIFAGNRGHKLHKWHHYIPIYDRYFSRFRGTEVKFLEIGVFKGGSMQVWRNYFGDQAAIFGIDIDPKCAVFDGLAGQVRIGSQDDPKFLKRVIDEMGGVDVVLDDGSHQMKHVNKTLRHLYPMLNDGGVYMVEDMHTAFWQKWGGGFRSLDNFFGTVQSIVEDMHHWYHAERIQIPQLQDAVSGIHIHDSIVVLEKGPVHRPTHSFVGD